MFKTVAIACMVAAATAANVHPREVYEKEFFEHMKTYKLEFKDGKEFLRRLSIFADMFDTIEKHNAGKHSYTMGLNQFSHLTYDEWIDTVKIGGARLPNLRKGSSEFKAPEGTTNPTEVNWVTAGAVTPVKNQGNCGSCWSFSATGGLEGAYFLKYGTLLSFSEQELVSCDVNGGDAGCNGGWMDDAFTYISTNGGITTEDQYPYTSGTTGKSGTCVTSGYTNVANSAPNKSNPFTDVAFNNRNPTVTDLETAVAGRPVSVAIQANQPAFQSYKSGVFTGPCGQRLDHGVLAAGYGVENGQPYWLVKNSWGVTWGEQGYIKILKDSQDLCGILDAASYPNL